MARRGLLRRLGGQAATAGRWAPSATWPPSPSIRPTRSPWAKAGPWSTDDEQLARVARSFRDWGRDCYCSGGENNTCGKRFSQQFGTLPYGYDHKYVYSHIGYNLKVTDIQAAIGCAQLKKLDGFVAARRRNWHALRELLAPYADRLLLPETPPGSEPRYFGFVITVRPDAGFTPQRTDRLPGSGEDRNPQPVLRQLDAPPGLSEHRLPHRRRPGATPTRS